MRQKSMGSPAGDFIELQHVRAVNPPKNTMLTKPTHPHRRSTRPLTGATIRPQYVRADDSQNDHDANESDGRHSTLACA
jgi:hypothetical protein